METKSKSTPQEIAAKLLDPEAFEEEQRKKIEVAEKKKKAELEKKASKEPKPKVYYDVKIECMVPATLTFKVLAEDANQAVELIKGKTPNGVQYKLTGRKDTLLKVYNAGGSILYFMKRLLG